MHTGHGGGLQGDVQKVNQTKEYAEVCYVAPPKEMACVSNCERELPGLLISGLLISRSTCRRAGGYL